ncbi:MAG: hypothetical protein AAFY70_06825, partial [Bacteroidota bacterium]
PYSFAENDVIRNIDLDGLEKREVTYCYQNDCGEETQITVVNYDVPRNGVDYFVEYKGYLNSRGPGNDQRTEADQDYVQNGTRGNKFSRWVEIRRKNHREATSNPKIKKDFEDVTTVIEAQPVAGIIRSARNLDNLEDVVDGGSDALGLFKKNRKEILTENRKKGAAFEKKVLDDVSKTQTGVVEQITVKTPSGVRTRLDIVGKDASGNIKLTEAKSSKTAPLTKNQKRGFPEIKAKGATVVGKGKGDFKGGTKIPPTEVDIVRPK